ncbi:hypothetical protein FB451DRAFT_1239626 [Mycena latifolia]|nr:hypothetical protein FB451DRAFT_1239626 [Mycena latifolia]
MSWFTKIFTTAPTDESKAIIPHTNGSGSSSSRSSSRKVVRAPAQSVNGSAPPTHPRRTKCIPPTAPPRPPSASTPASAAPDSPMDHDSLRRAFVRAASMTAITEQPRRRGAGLYPEGILPPAFASVTASHLAQTRAENEDYSLQILPAASDANTKLALAAIFIPTDAHIACALAQTPEPAAPVPQSVTCTRLPLGGTREDQLVPALAALEKRFVTQNCPPHPSLEVAVSEVAPLTNLEPIDADAVLDPRLQGEAAHLATLERIALDKAATTTLRAGDQCALTAVCLNNVSVSSAVLFVPDDARIPGKQSLVVKQTYFEGVGFPLTFRPFVRERQGEWELLGRHKRKRAVEVEDTERAPKRQRASGLHGQDTITLHSMLRTPDDNMWAHSYLLKEGTVIP